MSYSLNWQPGGKSTIRSPFTSPIKGDQGVLLRDLLVRRLIDAYKWPAGAAADLVDQGIVLPQERAAMRASRALHDQHRNTRQN
ncbi:hypothetical protein M2163_000401 [Streptomyces sp. SAI-135]|uniref:hypothetical protein n=1 Tax=unclassified Streptomyces TaxID=2593676 RepID=UPI0024744023|nr:MULTISPECIES: hypothetical protein [unclassified Streptomyces]MDH6523093.1 hypothetical protein [Streptomyces sp. SAI-090]MDH6573976.1 hypothetical protein [Streptomyces sp. SAI-117]MDH6581287.1 hypothetical protein [Streptomyces sp. SAI-133]MDH6613293.1 hypothetical protein [Streptomyces sp. SAI-135]